MSDMTVTINPLMLAAIQSMAVVDTENLKLDVLEQTENSNSNGNDKAVKRSCNKIKGKDSEVFAFKTNEEVAQMLAVFDKHIAEAANQDQRRTAMRNKLLFIIGINLGIRGSDLVNLKWCDLLDERDGSFKESYRFQPKKTANKGKWVRLYFNQAVQSAITEYISEYPITDYTAYIFPSRKGNEGISRMSAGRIIKSAAAECGIKQNINSHSLRKTWGYHVWHDAEDKQKALVTLQYIFNHASTSTTMKYIGIMDEDAKEVFDSLDYAL